MALPAWMVTWGNAICSFLRSKMPWIQLIFAVLGLASELLATCWEIKYEHKPNKQKRLGSNIAVAMAFVGFTICCLCYYVMSKLEGIRFRREYWCCPIGRAGNNTFAGSFIGILGIAFWCVHLVFAIADCFMKNSHKEVSVGFAIYPLVFSGLEVSHAVLMIWGVKKSYIIRCKQKFDRQIHPPKSEGCYLINCLTCPHCPPYDSRRDGARRWILTRPPDAAALEAAGDAAEAIEPEAGAGAGTGAGAVEPGAGARAGAVEPEAGAGAGAGGAGAGTGAGAGGAGAADLGAGAGARAGGAGVGSG